MTPARLIFPVLRWGERDVDAVWPDVRGALDLGVGGFVVFGGSVARMRELTRRAREHAERPLLFAADLERGAGQQLDGATPLPPAAALAGLDEAQLKMAARLTAQEATASGVGWVLAPVADLDVEPENPIVGTRSFGSQAEAVADRVHAWVTAAQAEGVHACAKHFPGHGRTVTDSHAELPEVSAAREVLEDDLAPFRAAVDAGVRSVMLAHVSYPALDPSGAPACVSPAILRLLREDLGFAGIVATDALIMEAVSASGRTEEEAAVEAVKVGCDVLLYPASPEAVLSALESAVESGALERERVAEAVDRVESAARDAARAAGPRELAPSYARALELATDSVAVLKGSLPRWRLGEHIRLHVVDDDVDTKVPAAVAAPGLLVRDRGVLAEALEARGARLVVANSESDAADLVAIFCEVRGWKGRSGLATETVSAVQRITARAPNALLVIFGHPRLVSQLPAASTVICAWGGDPLMQEAVAERLLSSRGR